MPIFSRESRQIVAVYRGSPERMVGHLTMRIAEIDPISIKRRA